MVYESLRHWFSVGRTANVQIMFKVSRGLDEDRYQSLPPWWSGRRRGWAGEALAVILVQSTAVGSIPLKLQVPNHQQIPKIFQEIKVQTEKSVGAKTAMMLLFR